MSVTGHRLKPVFRFSPCKDIQFALK